MDVDEDDRPAVRFGSAAATRVGVAFLLYVFPRFPDNQNTEKAINAFYFDKLKAH
jgi:hypothetical protein